MLERFGNSQNTLTMSKTGQTYSPVLSHQLWTVCILRRSDAHTKQRAPETLNFSPEVATIQARIWTHQSNQTEGAR